MLWVRLQLHGIKRIIAEIVFELSKSIKQAQCTDCKVYDFIDVRVSEDTVVQPDILIVCNIITKLYLDFPPTLVVEVLSPATALKDRNNKFRIYQNFGVKYYLIVDAESQQVTI